MSDIKASGVPEISGNDQSKSFTNYAVADYISESETQLTARWSPSFSGACANGGMLTSIAKGSIIERKAVGKCPDGKVVIMVVHH